MHHHEFKFTNKSLFKANFEPFLLHALLINTLNFLPGFPLLYTVPCSHHQVTLQSHHFEMRQWFPKWVPAQYCGAQAVLRKGQWCPKICSCMYILNHVSQNESIVTSVTFLFYIYKRIEM